ncbi:unconventional myosin-IXa isoform X3 [Ixodes scapularis]
MPSFVERVLEAGGKLEAVPVHDVAGLLKQWFRELPEPVVPKPLQTLLLRCQRERGLEAVQLALLVLPTGHVRVLRHTCLFLAEVARHSGCNRMDAPNLALVLAPNFFSAPTVQRPRGEPLQSQALLLQLLVEQAPQVGVVPPTLRGTMHAEVAGALPRQRRRTADTGMVPSATRCQRAAAGMNLAYHDPSISTDRATSDLQLMGKSVRTRWLPQSRGLSVPASTREDT